jgi:hypothetical protein
VDGVLRDEIPVDDVAENFVDAHAVLIDCEPLRRAEDRRRDVPAIVEIKLELIAGLVAECDAGQATLQRLQQIRGLGMIEIRRRHCLHIGGHLVAVDRAGFGRCRRARRWGRAGGRRLGCRARRRDRRRRDDANFGERDRVCICIRRRIWGLLCDSGTRDHHDGNKCRPARAAMCRGSTDATTAYSPPHGRSSPRSRTPKNSATIRAPGHGSFLGWFGRMPVLTGH